VNQFEIAVVCTGNRFRSPLAEHVLRRAAAGLPVRVGSFGVLDLGSVAALPEALDCARELGLDLAEHRTRRLGVEPLDDVDLVLGFEHSHVAGAVLTAQAPLDKTFTLPELVDLVDGALTPVGAEDPIDRARALIAGAARARPDPRRLQARELADPLGQPEAVYRRTAYEVRELTERLVKRLFGTGTASV
jgi:low molecular weight protein-tyrosine phosphatase